MPRFCRQPENRSAGAGETTRRRTEYAHLIEDNVSVARIYSGLDGGMNKVFLARFPGSNDITCDSAADWIISTATTATRPLGQQRGSLASKFFGALFEWKPASQTQVASTNSPLAERQFRDSANGGARQLIR